MGDYDIGHNRSGTGLQMQNNRTFVSYSRGDGDFAVRLASDLRARGAEVWLDQLDIEAGTRWDSAVEEALRASTRILVLLSPKAVGSQNVLDEVSFALDEGKIVVPILVETCAIPMRLRRVQHVDFTRDYDGALTRLLGTLGVARETAAEPPPVRPAPTPVETPPSPEPVTYTNSPASSSRRTLLLGAGAAAAVVLVIVAMTWRSGSGTDPTDTAPPSDTQASASAPAPEPERTTAPPPVASAAPAANTDGGAPSRPAPQRDGGTAAPSASGTRSGMVGGLFNAASPPTFPTGVETDAGLKVLLGLTRQFERSATPTQADMEQLAEAQAVACRGQFASSTCMAKASSYVESAIETVCARQAGPAPPASDEFATLKHRNNVGACQQKYLTVLLNRMDREAKDAIRNIKPG
jgi:hypothetical protein